MNVFQATCSKMLPSQKSVLPADVDVEQLPKYGSVCVVGVSWPVFFSKLISSKAYTQKQACFFESL